MAGGDRSRVRLQRCPIAVQFRDFGSGLHPPDFGNKEPISSLWDCLDVSGIFGVIVQRFPELANRHPEAAVKVDEGIAGPEAASKFLPADYFSGVFEEHDEEPIGLLLQPYAVSRSSGAPPRRRLPQTGRIDRQFRAVSAHLATQSHRGLIRSRVYHRVMPVHRPSLLA